MVELTERIATPSPSALWIKDSFDRLFALVVLLMLSPLLLILALAIKLTSEGPVLFRQLRIGRDDQPFYVYKFRSMHMHVEPDGQLTQATRDDPRITPLGRFMRRTSLDELPQFLNVLRGEMSVVGPGRMRLRIMSCIAYAWPATHCGIASSRASPAGRKSMAVGARPRPTTRWHGASRSTCTTSVTGRSAWT